MSYSSDYYYSSYDDIYNTYDEYDKPSYKTWQIILNVVASLLSFGILICGMIVAIKGDCDNKTTNLLISNCVITILTIGLAWYFYLDHYCRGESADLITKRSSLLPLLLFYITHLILMISSAFYVYSIERTECDDLVYYSTYWIVVSEFIVNGSLVCLFFLCLR